MQSQQFTHRGLQPTTIATSTRLRPGGRPKKTLSKAEHEDLVRRYQAGTPGAKLCARYGVSRATLYRIFRDTRVELRGSPRIAQSARRPARIKRYATAHPEASLSDLARRYALTSGWLSQVLRRLGIPADKRDQARRRTHRAA